jgi:hypothetical protein
MNWLFRITSTVLFSAVIVAFVLWAQPQVAIAQTPKATTPLPISVTTGLTYQALIAGGPKNSLTIQNNNTTDSCWIIIGGPFLAGDTTATSRTVNGASLTALKASIVLLPGGAYTRYWPYIPSDAILATCTTTGDSIYADTQ